MDWEWKTIATRPFGFFRTVEHPAIKALAVDESVFLAKIDLGVIDKNNTLFKTEMLIAIGNALEFPSYYGTNFDALDECIRDLEWIAQDHVAICLMGCAKAWREHYASMATLLEVVCDASLHPEPGGKRLFLALVD